LDALLKLAVQAPNGMNAQPWAFGVIQSKERLRAFSDRAKAYLVEHIAEFPMLERYRSLFTNPETNLFHNAPAAIIVFATPNGATPENDCTMAAHTIMLAAADMGLGTCWVGFFTFLLMQPEVKRELGIPEEYRPVAPIAIGYPAKPMPPAERSAPEMVFWVE
jgi:nitroreductase